MIIDIYEYWKGKFWDNLKKRDIHAIRAVIDEGYLLTNEHYAMKDSFLNETEIGLKDTRAHILRAAISASAKRFHKKGALDFEVRIISNSVRNSRHIELRRKSKKIYIARINYHDSIPKEANYRPITPNFEDDLFEPKTFIDRDVDSFVATYGDAGKKEFQFGDIGIVGGKGWLYTEPLIRGMYTYTTKTEQDEMLVSLEESLAKELEGDEENAEGEKK